MGHRDSCTGALAALVFVFALAGPAAAQAQKPAAARPDVSKQVEAVAQTQTALQEQLTELKQAINQLNERVQALAESAAQQREALAAAENAAKTADNELNELSKGLYVEVSGVKGDVGLARQDVQNLNATIESSRLGSGILIAAVIALQIILVLLAMRSRG